jgi:hypothetical protein
MPYKPFKKPINSLKIEKKNLVRKYKKKNPKSQNFSSFVLLFFLSFIQLSFIQFVIPIVIPNWQSSLISFFGHLSAAYLLV